MDIRDFDDALGNVFLGDAGDVYTIDSNKTELVSERLCPRTSFAQEHLRTFQGGVIWSLTARVRLTRIRGGSSHICMEHHVKIVEGSL